MYASTQVTDGSIPNDAARTVGKNAIPLVVKDCVAGHCGLGCGYAVAVVGVGTVAGRHAAVPYKDADGSIPISDVPARCEGYNSCAAVVKAPIITSTKIPICRIMLQRIKYPFVF